MKLNALPGKTELGIRIADTAFAGDLSGDREGAEQRSILNCKIGGIALHDENIPISAGKYSVSADAVWFE